MIKRLLILSLAICTVFFVQAQTRTVSGTVTDSADGSPLPGVNVLVKGTSTGTVTDINGAYSVEASASDVLVFSFIGYASSEQTVGAKSTIDFAMSADVSELDEVVVTALGISREKKSLGYAVTEVGGDEVTEAKEANFVNSLSGKVAGLQVSQNAAGMAGSSRVVLRGNSSLTGNNNVLYVVDGLPIDNTSNGDQADEYGNGLDLGNGVSDINPEDIESISVLKGATAAALYGSRATNGVILITTKKGRSGKGLGVSYTSNFVMDEAAYFPELQDEYGQGYDGTIPTDINVLRTNGSWGEKLQGQNALLWTGEEGAYSAQPDNMKDFFDLGTTWTNTVAIDGGSDAATYRLAYTNVSNKGIVPNSELKRNSLTLRGTAKLSSKLSADTKVTYVNQEATNRPSMSGWGDNVMLNLVNMPRNTSLSDLENYMNEDGSVSVPVSAYGNNPYHTVNENGNSDTRNRVFGVASLNYNLTDWMKLMVRGGTDYTAQQFKSYTASSHPFYAERLEDVLYTSQESNYDFLVSINKDISSNFSVGVNLGGNIRKNKRTVTGYVGSGYVFDGIYNILNTKTKTVKETAGIYEKEVQSLYASGQFGFLNAIFVDWTARNDWSSTLPEDNNSYFYPSISTSIVVSDLVPGLSNNVLSMLKVRASFAQTGNDTDPYNLSSNYVVDSNPYLGLNTAHTPTTLNNANLKPELTNSIEGGIDAQFLGGKIGLDLTFYQSTTSDQIIPIGTATESGYSNKIINAGEVENKGFELGLTATIIDRTDFTWKSRLNLSSNETSVIELDPANGIEVLPMAPGGGGGVFFVNATAGGGYGEIVGFGYKRNEQGQIVVDSEGLPLAADERQSFGDFNPDLLGGWSNTLTYKNISLDFLINFRQGGKIMSVTAATLDGQGNSARSLEGRDGGIIVPNSVTEAGDPNTTSVSAQRYWGSSYGSRQIIEDYVKDGDFIKFKELTLSYRLPNSLTDKTPFSNVKLGVMGRNLFFISREIKDFDPEAYSYTSGNAQGIEAYALPATRSYGFNLSVNF
ncbi:SusC/RagA family TonB-linked outer membrane protein [Reichenbachiella ulvae]|uniref:SusC/RagA family TonB-linked outer membrane protein n=1 Tax=Reichenbachiella ulvae TaxID=2980104 RepID=A0ABT3CTP5_9BACT|nr:SusC/RagA family TonB-linked outer membrane protein [Reichenbachiella ulvae]MCV9387085.1 SusC/RagA family TonB-linked outer membrane protein [Reichenbachiella ulvae]